MAKKTNFLNLDISSFAKHFTESLFLLRKVKQSTGCQPDSVNKSVFLGSLCQISLQLKYRQIYLR